MKVIMKVMEYCRDCLKGLADRTCRLSSGEVDLLNECHHIIDGLWHMGMTPPAIANRILYFIKDKTGIEDPYVDMKDRELSIAKDAMLALEGFFINDLEGVVEFSAIGNSTDIFPDTHGGFLDFDKIEFYGDLELIKEEMEKTGYEALILGDNIGDFLFDVKLIRYLEERGKKVYYAVKGHPVQNDLSLKDVVRYGFDKIFNNFVSTGTGKVGIEQDDMKGKIKELWEKDALVIAKGMGNYETISEFSGKRKVIHVMKIKCPAVSMDVSYPIGSYVAIIR